MSACQTCAPSLADTSPGDFTPSSAYFAQAGPGAPCTDCEALAASSPSDFAPGSAYFTPANPGAACTDCKALVDTNLPDLPATGGFANDPTVGLTVLQLELVGNDATTVTCQDLTTETVAAGTFTIEVDSNSASAVAAAKTATNQLATNQANAICAAKSQ